MRKRFPKKNHVLLLILGGGGGIRMCFNNQSIFLKKKFFILLTIIFSVADVRNSTQRYNFGYAKPKTKIQQPLSSLQIVFLK